MRLSTLFFATVFSVGTVYVNAQDLKDPAAVDSSKAFDWQENLVKPDDNNLPSIDLGKFLGSERDKSLSGLYCPVSDPFSRAMETLPLLSEGREVQSVENADQALKNYLRWVYKKTSSSNTARESASELLEKHDCSGDLAYNVTFAEYYQEPDVLTGFQVIPNYALRRLGVGAREITNEEKSSRALQWKFADNTVECQQTLMTQEKLCNGSLTVEDIKAAAQVTHVDPTKASVAVTLTLGAAAISVVMHTYTLYRDYQQDKKAWEDKQKNYYKGLLVREDRLQRDLDALESKSIVADLEIQDQHLTQNDAQRKVNNTSKDLQGSVWDDFAEAMEMESKLKTRKEAIKEKTEKIEEKIEKTDELIKKFKKDHPEISKPIDDNRSFIPDDGYFYDVTLPQYITNLNREVNSCQGNWNPRISLVNPNFTAKNSCDMAAFSAAVAVKTTPMFYGEGDVEFRRKLEERNGKFWNSAGRDDRCMLGGCLRDDESHARAADFDDGMEEFNIVNGRVQRKVPVLQKILPPFSLQPQGRVLIPQ